MRNIIDSTVWRKNPDEFQDELEYWKSRAARLSLLVDQVIMITTMIMIMIVMIMMINDNIPSYQISSNACKMVMVTLKAAQCKILKVNIDRKNNKR